MEAADAESAGSRHGQDDNGGAVYSGRATTTIPLPAICPPRGRTSLVGPYRAPSAISSPAQSAAVDRKSGTPRSSCSEGETGDVRGQSCVMPARRSVATSRVRRRVRPHSVKYVARKNDLCDRRKNPRRGQQKTGQTAENAHRHGTGTQCDRRPSAWRRSATTSARR
jgi:hypothetical protein